MKIQIVKKGNIKVKPYGVCPWLVDYPPDGIDVRKPSDQQ
jgi:hypothetical protein